MTASFWGLTTPFAKPGEEPFDASENSFKRMASFWVDINIYFFQHMSMLLIRNVVFWYIDRDMWPNQSSLEDPFPIARFCKAASILASGTAPAVDWCSRTSHMLGRSCTRQVLRNYSNINFELAHWIWKTICTIPITCLWWAPKRSKRSKSISHLPWSTIILCIKVLKNPIRLLREDSDRLQSLRAWVTKIRMMGACSFTQSSIQGFNDPTCFRFLRLGGHL